MCVEDPCENGGICVTLEDTYKCECPHHFRGKHCEQEIQSCRSALCKNGADCVDAGNGDFECVCREGFHGDLCEDDVDECASQPCRNDGVCINQVNRFTCECNEKYYGVFCQKSVQSCKSSPCMHGKCVDEGESFNCICEKGYKGVLCEVDIDECANHPCYNGGACIDKIGNFECRCPEYASGSVCELLDSNPDISHHQVLPGSVIAAVSGAGAVLLLIVGVIIAFFLDRKRKDTWNTEHTRSRHTDAPRSKSRNPFYFYKQMGRQSEDTQKLLSRFE
ncbi:SLIT2 [Bugula neritina]|uniref:SLIT2 n=1 Tax=Bugula neritina TaxID=10212 RepID=A0A7J7KQI9_BUGNE|nr:SLIT2 [Bugula neritina]